MLRHLISTLRTNNNHAARALAANEQPLSVETLEQRMVLSTLFGNPNGTTTFSRDPDESRAQQISFGGTPHYLLVETLPSQEGFAANDFVIEQTQVPVLKVYVARESTLAADNDGNRDGFDTDVAHELLIEVTGTLTRRENGQDVTRNVSLAARVTESDLEQNPQNGERQVGEFNISLENLNIEGANNASNRFQPGDQLDLTLTVSRPDLERMIPNLDTKTPFDLAEFSINRAPVATDFEINVFEGQSRPVNLASRGRDADARDAVSLDSTAIQPGNGTLSNASNTSITYYPPQNAMAGDGPFEFTYAVKDQTETSNNTGTVTVNIVSGPNSPQVIESDNTPVGEANQLILEQNLGTTVTSVNQPQVFIEDPGGDFTSVRFTVRDSMGNQVGMTVTTTMSTDGKFVSEPLPIPPIADGQTSTFFVTAQATSGSGNGAVISPPTEPLELVIDRARPDQLEVSTGQQVGDDTFFTMDRSPTFTIAESELNAVVEITRDGTALPPAVPEASNSIQQYSDPEELADGTYNFEFTQVDLAGNTSATERVTVVVDNEAPMFNGAVSVSDPVNTNLGLITTDQTPTLTFSVSDQDFEGNTLTAVLQVQGADGTFTNRSDETPIPGIGGTVSLTIKEDSPLAVGETTSLRILVKDIAGNSATLDQNVAVAGPIGQPTIDAPGTPVFSESFNLRGLMIPQTNEFGKQVKTVVMDGEEIQVPIEPGDTPDMRELRNEQIWQMSFDKETQTVWINLERGRAALNFDPATGEVDYYDFNSILSEFAQLNNDREDDSEPVSDDNPLNTENDVSGFNNPHGIFFDFKSHVNPRVWVVHRNAGGTGAGEGAEGGSGRLSYLDLKTQELVTYDLGARLNSSPSDHQDDDDDEDNHAHDDPSAGAHAVFVDDRGTVWIAASDGESILEVNFDQPSQSPSARNESISRTDGKVTVHEVPQELRAANKAGESTQFHPHGFDVIVDDQTGERYIWVVSAGGSANNDNGQGTGRVALLRTRILGVDNHDQPLIEDRWTSWEMPILNGNDLNPDGEPNTVNDVNTEDVRIAFVKIDDNETPGNPRDDRVIFMAPAGTGSASTNTAGLIHLLDPELPFDELNDVGSDYDANPAAHGTLYTMRLNAAPNATVQLEDAAPLQPFVDRDGGIYLIDRFHGIGRVDAQELIRLAESGEQPDRFFMTDSQLPSSDETQPDLENLEVIRVVSQTSITADLSIDDVLTTTPGDGQFQAIPIQLTLPVTTLQTTPSDLASLDGVDQYEVSPDAVSEGPGNSRGLGPFRGAFNATNVLYGSHVRTDSITTTVFAEIDRRQMAVVQDSRPKPAMANVEGRMAFQVIRADDAAQTGVVIMTHRDHGQILDDQLNLTALVAEATGEDATEIGFESDPIALVERDGTIRVIGKAMHQADGSGDGLIEYRLPPRAIERGPGQPPLTEQRDPANNQLWELLRYNSPGEQANLRVLAGKPELFTHKMTGESVVVVTTSDGKLAIYDLSGDSQDVTILGDAGDPPIYGNPSFADRADGGFHVFGVDQAGSVVEFQINRTENGFEKGLARTIEIVQTDGDGNVIGQDDPTRDQRIFQATYTTKFNDQIHLFGQDGTSRLVHLVLNEDGTATAENVTAQVAGSGNTNGFIFPQQGFEGRIYSGMSVISEGTGDDEKLFVYGTNGGELIEFVLDDTDQWSVNNLSNDTTLNDNDRITANAVFGAPEVYVDAFGNRHIVQVNADGEVVEYVNRDRADGSRFFTTVNINLARGNSVQDLRRLDPPVTITLPQGPVFVEQGDADGVTVAPNSTVRLLNADGSLNGMTQLAEAGTLVIRVVDPLATDHLFRASDPPAMLEDAPSELEFEFAAETDLTDIQSLLRDLQYASTSADEESEGPRLIEISLRKQNSTELFGDRVSQFVSVVGVGDLDDILGDNMVA